VDAPGTRGGLGRVARGAAGLRSRRGSGGRGGYGDLSHEPWRRIYEGITLDATSAKNDQDEKKREYKGKKGTLDITASLSSADTGTTKVEVSARKNTVEWDKDYAQQLLNKVIQRTS
jgi:hypothetical protein